MTEPDDYGSAPLQHRRWRDWRFRVVAVVVLCLGLAVFLSFGGSRESGKLRIAPVHPGVSMPSPGVVPDEPGPLALSPNGDLYMSDDALNEILERLPSGDFQVVAGNGKAGFSGDGRPAVEAELNHPLGIAVGKGGLIYFADSGNKRVSAVSPSGMITTVAGNGQAAAGGEGTPAAATEGTPLRGAPATGTAIGNTAAVTIDPDGSLYIAAQNAVLELNANGTLSTVAYAQDFQDVDQRFPGISECDPDGLAFDGSGDLFMTCSMTNDLLEETAGGKFTYRGILRPHDAEAALASSPDGSVIGPWQSAVYRYTAIQQQLIKSFGTIGGIGAFWPQGVAVAPDGTVYLDQGGVSGIGPPAIVMYSPSGEVMVLWTHANASAKRSAAAR